MRNIYFGFENGVPDRVPISLRGLEGPQEPTKENNHEVEPSEICGTEQKVTR